MPTPPILAVQVTMFTLGLLWALAICPPLQCGTTIIIITHKKKNPPQKEKKESGFKFFLLLVGLPTWWGGDFSAKAEIS